MTRVYTRELHEIEKTRVSGLSMVLGSIPTMVRQIFSPAWRGINNRPMVLNNRPMVLNNRPFL